MTRYVNDWTDELEARNNGLGAGTGAVNVRWGGIGPAPTGGFIQFNGGGAPTTAPLVQPTAGSGAVSASYPPVGAASALYVDPAAFDLLRMRGGARGSGGAGRSISEVGKGPQAGKITPEIPGESSAFPFAVNDNVKTIDGKPVINPMLILAALGAMFFL